MSEQAPSEQAPSEQTPAATTEPDAGSNGPRRLLSIVYGIFALAATARAGVQLATQFDEAPLAYSLSLFSGLVYIAATIGLVTRRSWSRSLTWVAVVIELVGVLSIGAASLIDPEAFPHDTVWSKFGYGYVFIPVVLPIAGLWWLFSSRGQDREQTRTR